VQRTYIAIVFQWIPLTLDWKDCDLTILCRINPRVEGQVDIKELENDLGTPLEPVEWLPGFYKLDGEVKIVNSAAYKRGQ
jgi:hypothetical protein